MAPSIKANVTGSVTRKQAGELAEGLKTQAAELATQAVAARKAAKQLKHDRPHLLGQNTKTRKSAQTRERILMAANDLIVLRGSTDFQMSEVATRCDMSKGALYYYFPDKDAIVEEIFSRSIDEFVKELEEAISSSDSAHEALERLCSMFGSSVNQGGTLVAAMASDLVQVGSAVLPEMGERFMRIAHLVEGQLDRAKTEGVVREDIDSGFVASCICGAFLSAAVVDVGKDGDAFDSDKFTNNLMNFVVNGVGAS